MFEEQQQVAWLEQLEDEKREQMQLEQGMQRVEMEVVVVQSPAPWTTARPDSLSFTISQSFLKFMATESVMPSNHLILCRPLLLLPSTFPSIFSNELTLHIRWPKYWSFSISPSDESSMLISSRIDWLNLLAVQGTLRSLLQHHNSKASVHQHSAFFIA